MTPNSGETFECRHCGGELRTWSSSRGSLRYYRCDACKITSSTADPAALRLALRAREPAPALPPAPDEALAEWRRRLDAFQARAATTDPFAKLGLSPTATLAETRARFQELATVREPAAEHEEAELAEIIEAYDQIRDRLAKQPAEIAAPAFVTPRAKRPRARTKPASWARFVPRGPKPGGEGNDR